MMHKTRDKPSDSVGGSTHVLITELQRPERVWLRLSCLVGALTMLVQLQVPILVVCVVSICIATLAIACRWWARALMQKRWQADDYLMLIAYLATCGVLINSMVFVFAQSYGMHLQDVPSSHKQHKHPESRFILTTLSLVASVFCNLSITQLYTTIFPHRRFRITCRVFLVLIACYGITYSVVQFFSCRRPKKMDTAMATTCMRNIKTTWVAASAVGMCIDLVNTLLPMPILWSLLHVDFWNKFRLTLLFGLGFFIVGITAVRIYLYRNLDMHDWTYHTGRIILFNGLEPALGVLAGCLPVMSPCLRLASDKIKSTWRSSRGSCEQQTPGHGDARHPPTIGQGKRYSLRAMRMGSQVGLAFERLDGGVYPLTNVTVGVISAEEKLGRGVEGGGKVER